MRVASIEAVVQGFKPLEIPSDSKDSKKDQNGNPKGPRDPYMDSKYGITGVILASNQGFPKRNDRGPFFYG